MKRGQLTEYNIRNIFPEKSYTKCGGETIPRPFSKKSKLSISRDQYSKVLYSLFLFCLYCSPRSGLSKVIETKMQTIYFYSYKAFFKNKKRSGTSLPTSFSA